MNPDQGLKQVADRYRSEGFEVTVGPQPDQLPGFATDFKVELLARRRTGGALVSVKKNRGAMQDDEDLPRYAEITRKQPGWRYDFAILEQESPLEGELRDAREPSAEEVTRALAEVETALLPVHPKAALALAWGLLEAAMRRIVPSDGNTPRWAMPARSMLNEIYASGIFSYEDFRQLENIFRLRNEIVHGFKVNVADPGPMEFLVTIARRLLGESQAEKQSV